MFIVTKVSFQPKYDYGMKGSMGPQATENMKPGSTAIRALLAQTHGYNIVVSQYTEHV